MANTLKKGAEQLSQLAGTAPPKTATRAHRAKPE